MGSDPPSSQTQSGGTRPPPPSTHDVASGGRFGSTHRHSAHAQPSQHSSTTPRQSATHPNASHQRGASESDSTARPFPCEICGWSFRKVRLYGPSRTKAICEPVIIRSMWQHRAVAKSRVFYDRSTLFSSMGTPELFLGDSLSLILTECCDIPRFRSMRS